MTTIALTNELIDHLIGARNRMTDRRDELIDLRAVDHIDAVLSVVPHGQRPDVDALLGRKRIVMVQHDGGAQEVHPDWIVAQAVTLPEAQEQADAKMAEYRLTNQPLTGDSVNDALITAANAHNVKAFEWRRTHPDWRTRR